MAAISPAPSRPRALWGMPVTLLAVLPLLALGGCVSPQQAVSSQEDNLAAAGFVVRPANTPERIAMMRRLPPNRFIQRPHGDTVDYVYADPRVCGCLYVGSQSAYGTYRRQQLQQQLVNEQQLTAMQYQDAAWSWGPWGYSGFGPGIGW